MAIFSSKKNTKKADKAPVAADKAVVAPATAGKNIYGSIIVSPRVTEKAGMQSSALNAYTFVVAKNATKRTVTLAVKEQYKVSPVAVNIIRLPGKTKFTRGRFSKGSEVKKAIVTLKKGDKIEFI